MARWSFTLRGVALWQSPSRTMYVLSLSHQMRLRFYCIMRSTTTSRLVLRYVRPSRSGPAQRLQTRGRLSYVCTTKRRCWIIKAWRDTAGPGGEGEQLHWELRSNRDTLMCTSVHQGWSHSRATPCS